MSRETASETERRLLKLISLCTVTVQEGRYGFEESPITGPPPTLDEFTVAVVRDHLVWSRLVRVTEGGGTGGYALVRFHFPENQDNSGFLGWLASHLKRKLGTGTFVLCGQNSDCGGIFDYSGFPYELLDAVLEEIAILRAAGTELVEADRAS